jgi:hypothetical protein
MNIGTRHRMFSGASEYTTVADYAKVQDAAREEALSAHLVRGGQPVGAPRFSDVLRGTARAAPPHS